MIDTVAVKEKALDNDLSLICKEILRYIPGVESIILYGSIGGYVKKTEGHLKVLDERNDYDVSVVIKDLQVPFQVRELKQIENKLRKSSKGKVKVDLGILPTFRILHPKGSLFFAILKATGITIWGKNYIDSLDPGRPDEADGRSWMTLCFYVMGKLIKGIDMNSGTISASKVTDALITHARVTLFFLENIWISDPEVIMQKLSQHRYDGNVLGDQKLIDLLNLALRDKEVEPLKLFFQVREQTIKMYNLFQKLFYSNCEQDGGKLVIESEKVMHPNTVLENFGYSFLWFFMNKEFCLVRNPARFPVLERMGKALMLLLQSVNDVGSVNKEKTMEAYNIINNCVGNIPFSRNKIKVWSNTKHGIVTHYHYARAVFQLVFCITKGMKNPSNIQNIKLQLLHERSKLCNMQIEV
ncbi:MAG: hypothetical protein ACOWW1_09965 [archaeon]